jgi:hypothetical protein
MRHLIVNAKKYFFSGCSSIEFSQNEIIYFARNFFHNKQ